MGASACFLYVSLKYFNAGLKKISETCLLLFDLCYNDWTRMLKCMQCSNLREKNVKQKTVDWQEMKDMHVLFNNEPGWFLFLLLQ